MFKLARNIRQTADIAGGYIVGTLVIENGKAYVQKDNGELIEITPKQSIEVYNEGDRKYVKISYEDAVTTMSTDGWSLFAGLDVRVK
jgi:hypothetical protein